MKIKDLMENELPFTFDYDALAMILDERMKRDYNIDNVSSSKHLLTSGRSSGGDYILNNINVITDVGVKFSVAVPVHTTGADAFVMTNVAFPYEDKATKVFKREMPKNSGFGVKKFKPTFDLEVVAKHFEDYFHEYFIRGIIHIRDWRMKNLKSDASEKRFPFMMTPEENKAHHAEWSATMTKLISTWKSIKR